MTENKHGFAPKQEIKIGGIAFTIIQTAESWVKCIASECIGERAFDAQNRNDFADTWWWTATPDSPKNPYVRDVYSDGTLGSLSAWYGSWGVRPLCVLKSEILKSYLDGDMKKRAEAVDMMKHIAAAWNIQPEEVFEEGR